MFLSNRNFCSFLLQRINFKHLGREKTEPDVVKCIVVQTTNFSISYFSIPFSPFWVKLLHLCRNVLSDCLLPPPPPLPSLPTPSILLKRRLSNVCRGVVCLLCKCLDSKWTKWLSCEESLWLFKYKFIDFMPQLCINLNLQSNVCFCVVMTINLRVHSIYFDWIVYSNVSSKYTLLLLSRYWILEKKNSISIVV